jgi:NIMA (never in mitosis gene a)-related kinase
MPRQYIVPHRGSTLNFVKELGRGQFGVARAVKNEKGKHFCLKEVSMKCRGDRARLEAQKEVNLMTKVREHPNIIKYFDHWFDNRSMFILMEYAPNGALDGVISSYREDRNRFTNLQVVHYLQQLATALAFMHDEVRVLHRDLKPENILVGQYGDLKIADFGLSKALAPGKDLCATFVGSPLYMSPELCTGEEYSFSTDIWSLGCIIYEVMLLRSPWEDDLSEGVRTIPALLRKIGSSTPRFEEARKVYPTKVVNTVKWMLVKSPQRRPGASDILDLLEIRAPPINEHHMGDTVDASVVDAYRPPYASDSPPEIIFDGLSDNTSESTTGTSQITSRNSSHEEVLQRQKDIIREAQHLAAQFTEHDAKDTARATAKAVMRIQMSFRASRTGRYRPPRAEAHGRKEEDAKAEVIQRAMRISLNRRHVANKHSGGIAGDGLGKAMQAGAPRALPRPRPRTAPTKPVPAVPPAPASNRHFAGIPPPSSRAVPQYSARLDQLAAPKHPRSNLPRPLLTGRADLAKRPPAARPGWI